MPSASEEDMRTEQEVSCHVTYVPSAGRDATVSTWCLLDALETVAVSAHTSHRHIFLWETGQEYGRA